MNKPTPSPQRNAVAGTVNRTMLQFGTCLVAAGLCLATLASGVSGQESPSLALELQRLEASYAITNDQSASLLSRLDNIEKKAFGSAQSGSAIERIERLNKHLNPGSQPNSQVPLTGTARFSQQVPSQIPAQMPGTPPQQMPPYMPTQQPAQQQIPNRPYMPLNTMPSGSGTSAGARDIPATGDYFDEVMQATKGKIMRFKTMPIPVYITPFPDSSFTDACIKGFVAWEDSSNGCVRFTQISDPNIARIKVIWSHLGIHADQTGCTLGAHTLTKWQERKANKVGVINIAAIPVPIVIPRFGPKYAVPPQIIEVNLDLIMARSADVRYLVLKNIVTHELGHALGLLGHSPVKADMMYSVTDEFSKLSPRDLNTLEKLYRQNKVDIPY